MTVQNARHLETVSAVEALEQDLAQRVLNGELEPGERLRELELSAQYGVGRHTLRAAFDGLVRRGLLEKARNRGVSVRELDGRALAEVYEVRTALEAQAVRNLAAERAVPADAREALARLEALSDDAPWRLVVEADFDFHSALVAATGNACLRRTHGALRGEILLGLAQLGQGYASVRTLATEHRALLEAIEAGRPGAAEREIRKHLEGAATWLAG
jgi:DNA-binding GntR family transcriptional regulator